MGKLKLDNTTHWKSFADWPKQGQTAARKGKWDQIEWTDWPPKLQRRLLDDIKELVPDVRIENGLEYSTRPAQPGDKILEGRPDLEWAAKELLLGDLEAWVEDDANTVSDAWAEQRRSAVEHLQQALSSEDPTKGSPELSLHAHAQKAMDGLKDIDVMAGFYKGECEGDREKDWVQDIVDNMAYVAFMAGRHTQAAWSKPFEEVVVQRNRKQQFFFDGRDEQIRTSKANAEERRAIIRSLSPPTNLKGEALNQWLVRKLFEDYGIEISERTIRGDRKMIRG